MQRKKAHTRGRRNVLRIAMNGAGDAALAMRSLHVLDLCLECRLQAEARRRRYGAIQERILLLMGHV